MRVLLLVVLVIGTATASPSRPAQEPVETVALRLARNRDTALVLTYDELRGMSTNAPKRELWDDEVTHFFERLADDGKRGVAIVGAKVVKAGTLRATPGERLLHDVDYAFVQLVVTIDNGPPSTRHRALLFIRTPNGWRFSPHQ